MCLAILGLYALKGEPFKHQPHKMVKHIQAVRRLLPTNCLIVFGHFVRVVVKTCIRYQIIAFK